MPVSIISLFQHDYRSNHHQSSRDITQAFHINVIIRSFSFLVVFIALFTVPVIINSPVLINPALRLAANQIHVNFTFPTRVSSTLPFSQISALFPRDYRSNHQQPSRDITQTSHIEVFTRPFSFVVVFIALFTCLLYTSPSPRD